MTRPSSLAPWDVKRRGPGNKVGYGQGWVGGGGGGIPSPLLNSKRQKKERKKWRLDMTDNYFKPDQHEV